MIDIARATMGRVTYFPFTEEECGKAQEIAKQAQGLFRQLQRARDTKGKHACRAIVRKLLESANVKFCYLIRAARISRGARSVMPGLTFAEIWNRAVSLHPYHTNEPVRLKFKPKDDSSYRPIVSFGWYRQALQLLCRDMLAILLDPFSFDFSEPGRGADAAAHYLNQLIEGGKGEYVLTADISSFFRSIDKKGVPALVPLPRRAVNNILLVGDDVEVKVERPAGMEWPIKLSITPDAHTDKLEADTAARQGLPQGCAASNIITSRAVLGPLLRQTPFADRVVLYGDNMAVVTESEEEAVATLEALRSELRSTPVGPLDIGRYTIGHIGRYIDYCKYRHYARSLIFGGGIRTCPSRISFIRREHRIRKRYLSGSEQDAEARVEGYDLDWLRSFPLWEVNEFSEAILEVTRIEAMRDAWRSRRNAKARFP